MVNRLWHNRRENSMAAMSRSKGCARIKVLVVVLVGLILLTTISLVLRGTKSDTVHGMRRANSTETGKAMPVHVNDRGDGARFTTVTHNAQEIDSKSLKETVVVATLDCPLPEHKNVIWCSTFQMAWDKLRTSVINEPIEVLGAEDLASRLNRLAFPATDIETQSYYANAGFVKKGLLEQIQKDMAKRFPSEPAPIFDDRYTAVARRCRGICLPECRCWVRVPILHLRSCVRLHRFKRHNGRCYGFLRTGHAQERAITQNVRDQVEILHYDVRPDLPRPRSSSSICAEHTQPYQVILARMPRCATLGEAAQMHCRRGSTQFKERSGLRGPSQAAAHRHADRPGRALQAHASLRRTARQVPRQSAMAGSLHLRSHAEDRLLLEPDRRSPEV